VTTLTLKVGISMSKDNTTGKDKCPALRQAQWTWPSLSGGGEQTCLEHSRKSRTTVPAMRTKAFTFIEVIIALTIVSISMLALLRLHLISIRMIETAEITSQAIFLADEKIAETLAAGYPKVESNCGTVERNGLTLNWQTQVIDVGLPQLSRVDITGLRSVLVDVSCKQGTGNKHLQMSTYVAEKEIK